MDYHRWVGNKGDKGSEGSGDEGADDFGDEGAEDSSGKGCIYIAKEMCVCSIIQVNEQALFSFKHFNGDIHYAFLMVGGFFTLLKYRRPVEITPYVKPAPLLWKKGKRAPPHKAIEVPNDSVDPTSIEPEVLCFSALIFECETGLSPLYLRALDYVAQSSMELVESFEGPSVFGVPPDTPPFSEEERVRLSLGSHTTQCLTFWCLNI